MGANVGRDIKRAGLAVLTSGTSEIKTGGGQYGDETVADTLFPKVVNDWALEGRADARKATDDAAQAAKDGLDANKPTVAPDFGDETILAAKKRISVAQGRQSTFLTGPGGLLANKSTTLLGG